MRIRRCLAPALAAVALAGCATEGGQRRDSPDPMPIPWIDAQPVSGGEELRVGYESDPCTRAGQARVDESESTVTVTLLDPDRDPEEVCIQLAEPGCALVELDEPLGDRRLADGAPAPFPQAERDARRLPFDRFGRCRPVLVVD